MAIIVKSPSWEHYPRGNLESFKSGGTQAPIGKKNSTDISVNPCILMHGLCVIELGERRFVTPRPFTVENNSQEVELTGGWHSQEVELTGAWHSQEV